MNTDKMSIMSYNQAKELVTEMVDIIQDLVKPNEFIFYDDAGVRSIEALDFMDTLDKIENNIDSIDLSTRDAIYILKAMMPKVTDIEKQAIKKICDTLTK